jgi:hypothetical protein
MATLQNCDGVLNDLSRNVDRPAVFTLRKRGSETKITGHVQLAGGNEGPELSSYLPYPVFQMATEIFLKGMWLCQFEECRKLTSSSYIDHETRVKHLKQLGGLGHDLIKIVEEVRKIPEYANSAAALKFLDLIERILRRYYFPPYQADKGRRWADARYPKRVYNDVTQQSQAENFQSYPPARWLAKLFREMEGNTDRIWSLQVGLSKMIKRSRFTSNTRSGPAFKQSIHTNRANSPGRKMLLPRQTF